MYPLLIIVAHTCKNSNLMSMIGIRDCTGSKCDQLMAAKIYDFDHVNSNLERKLTHDVTIRSFNEYHSSRNITATGGPIK